MSRESFLSRDKDHGTISHRRSRKQEKSLAERLGGRVTAGSGNQMEKGDVRIKGVLRIEAKTTKNRSFSVTLDMVEKIEQAAATGAELPVIAIDFISLQGKVLKSICVCPRYVLDEIVRER